MNKLFPDYSIQISTPDMFTPPEDLLCSTDHTWHGTAIAWHRDLHYLVKPVRVVHTRFAAIKLQCDTMTILAISLYLPTSGKDDEFAECLSCLTSFIAKNSLNRLRVLIGADTNCSVKSTQRRTRLYTDFCEELGLLEVGFSAPTFHHRNMVLVSVSNIDRFLITKDLVEYLGNVSVDCTLDSPMNFSSHDLLLCVLSLPSNQPEHTSTYSNTYDEYKRTKILWHDSDTGTYQEYSDSLLALAESWFPDPVFIPLKCELYSHLLVKSAISSCTTSTPPDANSTKKT